MDPVVGDWAERFFYLMPVRFWGSFGFLEVRLNTVAVIIGTAIVLVGATVALVRRRPRLPVVAMLTPFVAAFAVTAQVTWGFYTDYGRPIPGVQGRYLFVGLVGLVAVLGVAVDMLPARIVTRVPVLLAVGAFAMHGAATSMIVRHFWGGEPEAWHARLNDLLAWSPVPSRMTELVIGSAIVVLAALLFVCAAEAVFPRGMRAVTKADKRSVAAGAAAPFADG